MLPISYGIFQTTVNGDGDDVARHRAERDAAAAQRPEPIEGDGVAVLPSPIARGTALHDPDQDVIEHLAAWLATA